MNNYSYTLLVSLFIGAGIVVQGALNGRLGATLSPLLNGVLVMMGGGLVALLIFLAVYAKNLTVVSEITRTQLSYILISGAIGVIAIGGSTYIFPRLGIVMGSLSVLLGQMVIAFILDSLGFLGAPLPVTIERILGLLLVMAGVWLASPR